MRSPLNRRLLVGALLCGAVALLPCIAISWAEDGAPAKDKPTPAWAAWFARRCPSMGGMRMGRVEELIAWVKKAPAAAAMR